MSIKKFCIITLTVLLILTAIVVAVLTFGKNWAVSEVTQKISQKTEKFGYQVQVDAGSWLSDVRCVDKVVLFNQNNRQITMHHVCVTKGAETIMDENPDLTFTCDIVEGEIDWEDLKNLKKQKSPETTGLNQGSSGLTRASLRLSIDELRIKIGDKGKLVKIISQDVDLALAQGDLSASLTFEPALDIEKAPVAFRNMPQVNLSIQANLIHKNAQINVQAQPAFELAFDYNKNLYEAALKKIHVDYKDHIFNVDVEQISLVNPDLEGGSMLQIASVSAVFDQMPDSVKSLKKLKKLIVVEPEIKLDIAKFLAVPAVKNNPIISKLISFWNQDAGSFLGEAPKNSVKRADVKKNKPVVQRNPIPRETLDEIRKQFDNTQKLVQSLPAIEIRNGKIDIAGNHSHLSFDSISFNTAELFKDSQKFQLDFNVRQATASLLIAYDAHSPFPTLSLDVKKLAAADFMHVLNMPVPDKNNGLVSLDLAVSMQETELHLEGSISFEDFAFYHQRISPNLIHDINASARMDLHYFFDRDALEIKPVSITSGPITVSGFFNIDYLRSNPTIQFEFGAKDIPCEDIAKAIPPGLLPTITDLQIGGSKMSPKISGTIPWKYPLTSKLSESGFDNSCYPISVVPHHPEMINDKHYTFTTEYTYYVDKITVGPGTKSYVPLEKIPPYVRAAMFLTEDKRFFDHGPLRIAFIERALRLNLNQRKYVYGGSTIAQQLTKNLFLNRNKNLARKLEEAFIAWRLETVVTRSRIFELYLNMIEFGPDIYGIRNASQFYFDKEPSELTPLEGAYLASLKVSPSKGGRFYKFGFPSSSAWWRKRFKYILRVLAENGYISPIEVLEAHDWTPKFVYPPAGKSNDYRAIWLVNYGNSPQPRERKTEAQIEQNTDNVVENSEE